MTLPFPWSTMMGHTISLWGAGMYLLVQACRPPLPRWFP